MLFSIKKIIRRFNKSEDYKRILENIASLSLLQIANYLLPLIVFPYLIKTLGLEYFGKVSFALAFTQYFQVISNYGFSISGIRQIAINSSNKNKLNDIIWEIQSAKLLLLLLCLSIFTLIIISFKRFNNDVLFYYYSFGIVLGEYLFPVWIYQGLEKMKLVTILNLISKLLFTILIFFYVRKPSDYIMVPLFNSLGFIIAGILSVIYMIIKLNIKYKMPKWKNILFQYKEGWHIFLSNISIKSYTTTNVFILGIVESNLNVGLFVTADKIIRVLVSIFEPVAQAFLPFITKKNKDIESNKIVYKLFKLFIISSFILLLLVVFFKSDIAKLLVGKEFKRVSELILFLSPLLLILPMSMFFLRLIIIPFQLDKLYSKIYLSGATFSVLNISIFVLILKLAENGAIFSSLITESFIMLLSIYYVRKNLSMNKILGK